MVLLVLQVDHNEVAPAPAPPPLVGTAGECDWCDALLERLDFPSLEELDASSSMSDGIRAHMHTECIPLYQRDFANGTFLAETDDTCYKLAEDIVFDPAPWADYRASAVEPYNRIAAFRFDFFAAFAVSADGVTLDLNGKTLLQGTEHFVEQRFFALVEIGDRPFLRGQGPGDFSGTSPGDIVPATRFTLMNGKLGRTSHHSVHGNNCKQVMIVDVDMSDYEVAAIHLNGARDVLIDNVRALGTNRRVPVMGTYSSVRFEGPFIEETLANASAVFNQTSELQTAVAQLNASWTHLSTLAQQAKHDIVTEGLHTVDPIAHPEAYELFGNPIGLPDGGAAYGILIHNKGVAVNGFECDAKDPRNDLAQHILIRDCEVANTRAHVHEVVGIRDVETGTMNRGPDGSILRIEDITNRSTGAYRGTALSDTQIALAQVQRLLGRTRGSKEVGTTHIHPYIHEWASGNVSMLADKVSNGELEIIRNGDSMFHVNKGVFGIRISGGHYVCIERCRVANVENHGPNGAPVLLPGETSESAFYLGASDGGHPFQAPQSGYMGADAYGIGIDAANSVLVRSVIVRDIYSATMWARGAAIFNDATRSHTHDITVVNVTSFVDQANQANVYTPKLPQAVGIYTANDAELPSRSGYTEINSVRTDAVGIASHELHAATGIDQCSDPSANTFTA